MGQPSGVSCATIKTRKNRWAIDTGGASRVVVRYRVYGREMTVRTNWIDGSRFALLQGPATYLTLVERTPTARTRSRWTCQPAGPRR